MSVNEDVEITLLQLAKQMKADGAMSVVPTPPPVQTIPPYALDPGITATDTAAAVLVNGVNEAMLQASGAYADAQVANAAAYNAKVSKIRTDGAAALDALVGKELTP